MPPRKSESVVIVQAIVWGSVIKAALVISIGAMSPGPSLAIVVRNTALGGRLRGMACAVGHGVGFGIYAMAVVVGFSLLIANGGALHMLLQWTGAALLVWLGFQMLRSEELELDGAHEPEGGGRRGFAEGVLIAFFNPKIAVFLVAVLSQVIQPGMGIATQVVIGLVGGFVDTMWYVIVACALSGSSILIWVRANAHMVNRSIGCLLIGLALLLVLGELL